jgi:hypothetical protein
MMLSAQHRLARVALHISRSPAHSSAPSGIALLEHVNINISHASPSDEFFFQLLGLVPSSICDPERILHANMGLSQMHLPVVPTSPQTWNGAIGLAYTEEEFGRVRAAVSQGGSQWSAEELSANELVVTGPHATRYHLHSVPTSWSETSRAQGSIHRGESDDGDRARCAGLLYVEVLVAPGAAAPIHTLYSEIFEAKAQLARSGGDNGLWSCVVHVGSADGPQQIRYRETQAPLPDYDGHHLAIYLDDYESAYLKAVERGLVWNNPRFNDVPNSLEDAKKRAQFRMKDLVNLVTGEVVHELEHEVRCRHTNKLCPIE